MRLFLDRQDAGRRLAEVLAAAALDRPMIYALPRGGVPVGFEVARRLNAPLDLLIARKIGAPGAPELALGAIAEGERSPPVVNEDVRRMVGVDEAYVRRAAERELEEIERRRLIYRQGRKRASAMGRIAVVVDDGLATGATAKAAIMALKADGAKQVVLAVPVGPPDTVAAMQSEADQVFCLETPAGFGGVGQFYADFHQLTDEETVRFLDTASAGPSKAG